MKKNVCVTKLHALCLLVLVLSLGFAGAASADPAKEEGALTTKPPTEDTAEVKAAYKYLSAYTSDVSYSSGGKGSVIGNTGASVTADFIGIDAAIQRWTGEEWVAVTSKTSSKNTSKTVSLNESFAASAGYYYRVVSTHTVRVGSDIEKATYTSPSRLLK
ncbi:hypothetical protein [Paenibacillus sp. An7]|uniref:hypothetical protein n=1 Tax=Paenibacillus sp. An7 TaxID=2689577 RepID=UPI00135814AC|nr:hypothetical protein [Paenibacillus sp. An7]